MYLFVQTGVKDMPAFGRGFTDIKSVNIIVQGADFVENEGERWLAAVVLEQELLGGGGAMS
jgi:hypothetical protein